MTETTPSPTIPERLRWFGLTDQGKVRNNNEDSFLCLQFDARELYYLGKVGDAPVGPTDFVFAVSDGMGGAMAGEFASRITVDKITSLLPASFKRSAKGLTPGHTETLVELFDRIHKALLQLGQCYQECKGMGATLSMCWFSPGWMYFAHIGDSRIYYLPAGETALRRLSHDDTYVDWLFRTGKINEREARTHPRRNLLQRALGANHQFVNPQVGSVTCEPGDMFLLCTDGLVEGLFDEQLGSYLRTPSPKDNPAQCLVRESLERSGRDNTTALVIVAE